jgi:hypothetical protein
VANGIDIAKGFPMRVAIAVVVVFIAAESGYAQAPTFRQLAVATKGRSGNTAIGCGWAGQPLASIVKSADLAVEATLLSKRTYATPDDRDIFTEYEVAPTQVIFQRSDRIGVRAKPPTSMVFKTRGGTVIFDGYLFTFNVISTRRRAHELNAGEHVILFGRYDKSDGKWMFGPNGFFQVSGNVLLNWLPILEDVPSFVEYVPKFEPNMLLADFTQRVRELTVKP